MRCLARKLSQTKNPALCREVSDIQNNLQQGHEIGILGFIAYV